MPQLGEQFFLPSCRCPRLQVMTRTAKRCIIQSLGGHSETLGKVTTLQDQPTSQEPGTGAVQRH